MKHYISIIFLDIHWGFSVRKYPASATQTSYMAPSPPSIVGSLACAYSSLSNDHREYSLLDDLYSYTMEFIKRFDVKYASACVVCDIPKSTLQTIRYFTMPFQLPKKDIETFSKHLKVSEMFAPLQLGYTIYDKLILIVISRKEIPLNTLWSITRIGSKESLVYVTDIFEEVIEPEEVGENTYVKVNAYTPISLGSAEGPSNFIVENMPFPLSIDEWKSWFSFKLQKNIERTVMIPLPPTYLTLKTLQKCFKFTVANKYIVLVPTEVIKT
ncbi:MAG: type I-A CRISPR-associated protein Cas5a [Candidatus Methanomethylicia archaeon]